MNASQDPKLAQDQDALGMHCIHRMKHSVNMACVHAEALTFALQTWGCDAMCSMQQLAKT